MDRGVKLAIEGAGSITALARLLGIHRQAVQGWNRVPADRIVEIERVTGIDRAELRPDLFLGWTSKKE